MEDGSHQAAFYYSSKRRIKKGKEEFVLFETKGVLQLSLQSFKGHGYYAKKVVVEEKIAAKRILVEAPDKFMLDVK